MKRVTRTISRWWFFYPVLLVYGALGISPASFWFTSRSIEVSDAIVGSAPTVVEDRSIFFSFYGGYSAKVRDAVTGKIMPRCVGSADFPYRGGLDGLRTMTLVEWVDNQHGCALLPVGQYVLNTCRLIYTPLFFNITLPAILPPKTSCRLSNIFTITEGENPRGNGKPRGLQKG